MVKKLDALKYAKCLDDKDFGTVFTRTVGFLRTESENNPDAAYPATEVAQLMDYLFEVHGR